MESLEKGLFVKKSHQRLSICNKLSVHIYIDIKLFHLASSSSSTARINWLFYFSDYLMILDLLVLISPSSILKAPEESGRRRRSARIAAKRKIPMFHSYGKDSHGLHHSPSESNGVPSLSLMIGKCRIQSSKEGDVPF